MREFKLRPLPKIDVYGLPAAAIDVKTRRLLDKELRAAWGERQARWQSATNPVLDSSPTLYLSCSEERSAVAAIAVKVRIGLAHLVHSVRRRLPEWVIHFSARGTDGELELVWPLDVGLDDIAESLLGRVPKQRIPESEGRRFWNERDGGISLLGPGAYSWNPKRRGLAEAEQVTAESRGITY